MKGLIMSETRQEHTQATAAQKFQSLEIKSDGTQEGTTILLNGKPIKNLYDLRFGFMRSTYSQGVDLEIVTEDQKVEQGTMREMKFMRLVPPARNQEKGEASLQPGPIPADRVSLAYQGESRQKAFEQIKP